LYFNAGEQNTAVGDKALQGNRNGSVNTAIGVEALFNNTSGNRNTASGDAALYSNTTGNSNTADGIDALAHNTTGILNNAHGDSALFNNTTGQQNNAIGVRALYYNTTGSLNIAIGDAALLQNTTGENNIGLGIFAGGTLTTGDFNIDIGNYGVTGDESGTIRIGTLGMHSKAFIAGISGVAVNGTAVVVGGTGQLGVAPSSKRFKDKIKPMGKASEAVLALKPVMFHYTRDIDPTGTAQFGLVAEDVEKVNSDLVVRDQEGKPYSVRYDQVNAMLLNEFLKEHRKVQELESAVAQLTAHIKEQDSKLQKVSDQLEMRKATPQVVSRQ
jgi:hypothetical protein